MLERLGRVTASCRSAPGELELLWDLLSCGVLGGSAGSPGAAEGVAASRTALGWEESGTAGSGSSGSRHRLAAPRRETRDCRSCQDSPSALARLLFWGRVPPPRRPPQHPLRTPRLSLPTAQPARSTEDGVSGRQRGFSCGRPPARTDPAAARPSPPARAAGSRPWIPGE